MNLPEHRFKGPDGTWSGVYTDDIFIKEMLLRAPVAWHRGICKKYSTIYQEQGRYAANTWLRRGVNEFT